MAILLNLVKCTFLARSVRLGRRAADATLAVVVSVVLCIAVS